MEHKSEQVVKDIARQPEGAKSLPAENPPSKKELIQIKEDRRELYYNL